MKKFYVFLFSLLCFDFLYSNNNFFNLYYLNSSFDLSKYSFSYARVVSTNIVTGIGFDIWDNDFKKTNYLKSNIEFSYSGFGLALKPFYFFKDKENLFGGKFSFSLIKAKDDVLTTYGLILNYTKEKKNDFSYFNFFIEKNYYDEFFIIFQPGFSLRKINNLSFFDTSYMFNTLHNGFLNYFLYSSFSFIFARSFKPDFNSYVYIGFDRLNSKLNDINSYTFGLRTYIDEKSDYYLDLSYNFADNKSLENEKIWKISLGGVL